MNEINFIADDGEELKDFDELFEHAFPESHQKGMLRQRAYEGQSHTDHGERGKTQIEGITFRDLRDCFIRACCLSAGGVDDPYGDRLYDEALKGEEALIAESDIRHLPWNEIDVVAVAQNLACEVEKIMDIFPNIPDTEKS